MKGIAHFTIGVAFASCFPEAVRAGADGHPLFFILGGVFGLLPDTLDFKFYQFFFRHDVEVTPDPLKCDAKMIARAVADSVNRAFETGKPVRIKLDTIQLGVDRWQQYEVTFDTAARKVVVTYGPVVDTGGNILDAPPVGKTGKPATASASVVCPVKLDYQATTTIDAFSGPVFRMNPNGAGAVVPQFIPWHRQWSHSVVLACLFGLAGWATWGWVAGAVIAGAYSLHVLVDQLGFMGSNWLFPFRSVRTEGMKRMHSMEPLANFGAVWLSGLVIFWNLYCSLPWRMPEFNMLKLAVFGFLVPFGVLSFLYRRWERKREAIRSGS